MSRKLNHPEERGSTNFPPKRDVFFHQRVVGRKRFGQKKEPLEVLPPRVHTGVGVRHALFPIDWLFGAWTCLSTHPASSFGCQFPDAIHRPRVTAGEKFRPHSRAAATIPDRSLLSEASLLGSVRTCRHGRAKHGVDSPTRITL